MKLMKQYLARSGTWRNRNRSPQDCLTSEYHSHTAKMSAGRSPSTGTGRRHAALPLKSFITRPIQNLIRREEPVPSSIAKATSEPIDTSVLLGASAAAAVTGGVAAPAPQPPSLPRRQMLPPPRPPPWKRGYAARWQGESAAQDAGFGTNTEGGVSEQAGLGSCSRRTRHSAHTRLRTRPPCLFPSSAPSSPPHPHASGYGIGG